MSGNQFDYRQLLDEEDMPPHGVPDPRVGARTGSGSGTVNQRPRRSGSSGSIRSRARAEDDLPPPPANDALIHKINLILRTPGRIRPKLCPDRAPDTLWFGVDCSVAGTVGDVIRSHFPRPYYNWRDVTGQTIRDQWFEMFTQYYTWDEANTPRVRQEFERKACKRLTDIVCRWKDAWRAKGDDAMPTGMDPTVWQGLVAYWISPRGKKNAESASKSRNTPVAPGDVSNRHRLGRTPMAGLRLQMADPETGEVPPIVDVYDRAYRRPDGTYVTKQAENLRKEYDDAVAHE